MDAAVAATLVVRDNGRGARDTNHIRPLIELLSALVSDSGGLRHSPAMGARIHPVNCAIVLGQKCHEALLRTARGLPIGRTMRRLREHP